MRIVIGALLLFATVAGVKAQDAAPPSVTFAPPVTPGVGNLPPDFYPKSPCTKPDAASIGDKPKDARDLKAVQEFNQRVQTYNKVALAFNGCVTDYARKAESDIARIQAAIRDANAH